MEIKKIAKKLIIIPFLCISMLFTNFVASTNNLIMIYGEIKNISEISKEDLENSITLLGISNKDGSTININLILNKKCNIEIDIPSEDIPFLKTYRTESGLPDERYNNCRVLICDYDEHIIQAILQENFGKHDRIGYLYKNENSEYKCKIYGNNGTYNNVMTLGKKLLTIYTSDKKEYSSEQCHYDLYKKYRVYELNIGVNNVDVELLKSYWPNK